MYAFKNQKLKQKRKIMWWPCDTQFRPGWTHSLNEKKSKSWNKESALDCCAVWARATNRSISAGRKMANLWAVCLLVAEVESMSVKWTPIRVHSPSPTWALSIRVATNVRLATRPVSLVNPLNCLFKVFKSTKIITPPIHHHNPKLFKKKKKKPLKMACSILLINFLKMNK